MWWTGPWAIAGIEKANIDYGILPMGKPFVGIKTIMLSKNAVDRGNQDVAMDIIKYFTSPEVQKKLALVNKTIPAQTSGPSRSGGGPVIRRGSIRRVCQSGRADGQYSLRFGPVGAGRRCCGRHLEWYTATARRFGRRSNGH